MGLEIERADTDNACVITVSGEVDLYSSPQLRSEITSAFGLNKSQVVVDLRNVNYMDSSGVATLIEGLRTSREKNMKLILMAPSTPVRKVLELSRLSTVFDIQESL